MRREERLYLRAAPEEGTSALREEGKLSHPKGGWDLVLEREEVAKAS